MPRVPLSLAACATLLICLPAFAGTLRCTQVNGNLNCAGSGAVSCQTVNGRTVCSNGSRDVMQSFGGAAANDPADDHTMDDDPDEVEATPRRPHIARPRASDR
jgi:hypothetical protein